MTGFALAAKAFNLILFGGGLAVTFICMTSVRMLHGLSAADGKPPEEIHRMLYLIAMVCAAGLTLELIR